ncbi:NAD-dependent epimerase/dehydratase family protein [Acetobacter vaccinii]|uniref:NAD(P)-dependent oxidoreductase n=1 Tax=Acetobacter vaccinii TaxID=2592655 RepID=A0A5C1YJH3_9PROT|nr:NAD(P)-dependent oxidoreductase [Acetobacter vaccinii]QEO16386.1 NAD(P)-dependent oxidoreductase [Acetobacter vaccinii]
MKVLVTGASGFLGSAVIKAIRATEGMTALAGGRRNTGPDSVVFDILSSPATLATALAGVDAVVHCAAGSAQATVAGTRNTLEACRMAGVRQVVHISSIAVYGNAQGTVLENTPQVKTTGRSYAASKAMAEALCLSFAPLNIIRLRPTIIYGPDSPLWVTGLIARMKAGYWGTYGAAGNGTCNLVHVADVASAVVAALQTPQAGGQAFNINGPDTLSWNDWFRDLAQAAGLPPLRPVPEAVLYAQVLASLPFKLLRRAGIKPLPAWATSAPAPSEVRLFRRHATYPTQAAAQAMGWAPCIKLAQGLASLNLPACPSTGEP